LAREWSELYSEICAHYPTALGSSGQDTTLALAVLKFFNSLQKRINTDRRWSLSYYTVPQATTPGTSVYAIPTGMTNISHLYWLTDPGQPVTMESYDVQELRRRYGDGPNAQQGQPQYFAVIGSNIQIFPAPDAAGPTSGNYTLNFEGYNELVPVIETTGTTTTGGSATTLTIPSTAYLTTLGVATSGSAVSILSAGYAGPGGVAGTLLSAWSAFPSGTQVTIAPGAQAVVTAGKVFFNSANWLIQNFDQVALFGTLREVAAYLKENFDIWDKRFEMAYDDMARFDVDRRKTLELQGVAVTGQRQLELARNTRYGWGAEGGYW
jgi:hypothetical protein